MIYIQYFNNSIYAFIWDCLLYHLKSKKMVISAWPIDKPKVLKDIGPENDKD